MKMSTKLVIRVAAITAVTCVGGWGGASVASASISIPTVPVGNIGNTGETTINGTFGSVGYQYNIGATEVTNAQYAAFLNAVAVTDTNSLYNGNGINTGMAGTFGGITRSGGPGTYSYSTVSGRANNPVNFVSFWDAARFANWLHNGQPSGPQGNATTEDGAYTLTTTGITNNTVTRNSGWQWAVTSTNEWYKAAFYQPANQGGDVDNYWLYPTSSNTAPNGGQANIVPSGFGNTTTVASYAPNFYGAYDMAGNVYEWNDTIYAPPVRGPLWGGAFDNVGGVLSSGFAYTPPPFTEREQVGFRVVTIPGPSSVALLAIGGVAAVRRRRRTERVEGGAVGSGRSVRCACAVVPAFAACGIANAAIVTNTYTTTNFSAGPSIVDGAYYAPGTPAVVSIKFDDAVTYMGPADTTVQTTVTIPAGLSVTIGADVFTADTYDIDYYNAGPFRSSADVSFRTGFFPFSLLPVLHNGVPTAGAFPVQMQFTFFGVSNFTAMPIAPGLSFPIPPYVGEGFVRDYNVLGGSTSEYFFPQGSWSQRVPAPGAAAILGLGGLFAIRRRRD